MTELIPVGNTDANSDDFNVTGTSGPATLFLKTADGANVPSDAVALVQAKTDDLYFTIGQITASEPCKVLDATGTFRVRRPGCTSPFGVEQG